MHAATALARFLPTDPGYAPFGWPWLRGLNVLQFALVAFIGLLWGSTDVLFQLGWDTSQSLADLVAAAVTHRILRSLIAFTPMLILVTIADNLTEASPRPTRVALLAAATLLGAAIPTVTSPSLGCLQRGDFDSPMCDALSFRSWNVGHLARALLWSAAFTTVLYFYKRERSAARELHATQLRRLNAERQETEARLRSLQAQIEPHFLFNTLAHIQRLYQVQPAQGQAMLRNLVDYLHSALPQMRQSESTLGRELALARAYLSVQQIRMGERLRIEIAVPDALAGARLPPMMLLTLVENAIKHGLGPKPQGGTLRIVARDRDRSLEVEVSDDGVGLKIGAGTGRGLANTRARLATLFAGGGSLQIANGPDGGAHAILALPLEPAQGSAR
jgi:signal transduction histidine kinase